MIRRRIFPSLLVVAACGSPGATSDAGGPDAAAAADAGQDAVASGDDFAFRCGVAEASGGRCSGLDTAVPPATGRPVGGQMIDVAYVSDGTKSGILDATVKKSGAGSFKIFTPGDGSGGTTNNSGQVNLNLSLDGSLIATPSATTDGTPVSGPHDFYVQWAQRMDANRLVYNGDMFPAAVRAIKQLILTLSDKYIDEGDWFIARDCSEGEIVVDGEFNLVPQVYFGCTAYDGLTLNGGADARSDLIQPATGCTRGDAGRSSIAVTSIGRDAAGVLTFQAALPNAQPGRIVYVTYVPPPDKTKPSTPLGGMYVLASASGTTFTATRLYGTGAPEPIATFTPPQGTVGLVDDQKCFLYKPDQFMHFQLHIAAGTDWVYGSSNKHHDTTIELWAGYEGQPSRLLVSIPGYDANMTDQGGACGNLRYQGAGSCYDADDSGQWWPEEKSVSGYGRADFMHYETQRCGLNLPAAISMTHVARAGGKVTVELSHAWVDGSGGQICAVPGKVFALVGTTLDGGSFNRSYTIESSNGSTLVASDPCTGCSDVSGPPGGGAKAFQVPEYSVLCNGGPCDATEWFDEVVLATHRIPDPGHASGVNPYPDPPDHLAATASAGGVALRWTCNDPSASYLVKRFQGAMFAAESAQAYAVVGAADACAARYDTQTFTDTTAAAGTTYTYVVSAKNAAGESTRSNPAQITHP